MDVSVQKKEGKYYKNYINGLRFCFSNIPGTCCDEVKLLLKFKT